MVEVPLFGGNPCEPGQASDHSGSGFGLHKRRRPPLAFQLLGHGCPYGAYPSPVIPVGLLDGSLVAIYPGGKHGPTAELVDEKCGYVRHGMRLRRTLRDFDYRRDRLFGHSAVEIIKYPVDQEKQFLAGFLKAAKSRNCIPSIRSMLERAVLG